MKRRHFLMLGASQHAVKGALACEDTLARVAAKREKEKPNDPQL
jgi:hypothetical protein